MLDTLAPDSPILPDVLTLISQLSTSQATYLEALIHYGADRRGVELACKAAEVQSDTVSKWRAPSSECSEAFNRAEGAIREHRTALNLAMARQTLQHSAALTAHRMVQTATAPDDGPRTMPTRQRARETILEAVGVIQRHPTDSEAAAQAMRVMAAMRAAYLASISPETQHNVVQSSQSALPLGVPDTIVDVTKGT